MNKTVGRRRIDRLYDLADLVDVDLVWKLRPENDARGWEVAPDSAGGFNALELWHLDVENAHVWFLAERDFHGLLAVPRFEDRNVRRKLFLENLAEVVALGHVIFSNQN